MAHRESVIAWLNDAYGMEKNAIQMLEHRVSDTKDHPRIQAMVQQHLQETRRHAEQVESCIKSLGSSVSTIKSSMGTIGGTLSSLSTGMASDEAVKNALADYSYENFEIACYTSLIAAAEAIGESQVASICNQILRDEQKMATFLLQNIPTITQEYLGQQAREHNA